MRIYLSLSLSSLTRSQARPVAEVDPERERKRLEDTYPFKAIWVWRPEKHSLLGASGVGCFSRMESVLFAFHLCSFRRARLRGNIKVLHSITE